MTHHLRTLLILTSQNPTFLAQNAGSVAEVLLFFKTIVYVPMGRCTKNCSSFVRSWGTQWAFKKVSDCEWSLFFVRSTSYSSRDTGSLDITHYLWESRHRHTHVMPKFLGRPIHDYDTHSPLDSYSYFSSIHVASLVVDNVVIGRER